MGIISAEISAGFTYSETVTLPDYPAPDWAVALILRGPTTEILTGVPSGASHRFSATAAETAAWAPGLYAYSLRASKGFEVVKVEEGKLKILPDLTKAAAGAELRSMARITLDNIEAVIQKRATQDQQKYRINNRELWRTDISELLRLRNTYRAEVRAEEAAARGENIFGRQVRMRLQ